MPRATKKSRLKAKARQAALRVLLAERECRRTEVRLRGAHAAVKAAYIELGRALLAGEIGNALRSAGGKK
jgi:hypothetical protein